MITVRDYLSSRFSKSYALTRKEAIEIGLKWPLLKGWVDRYGSVEISDSVAERLKVLADARKGKNDFDRIERKERKRLNRLVSAGAIDKKDADRMLAEFCKEAKNKRPEVKASTIKVQKRNDGFYESREWRELRYKALVLHGATCQCCGTSRKDGARLHVDHIKPRSKFPKLQLDLSNLQVLCEDCNLGKSNKDSTDWRGLNDRKDL